MDAMLIPAFTISTLVAPIACFLWQLGQVRRGISSRADGALRYVGRSATPLLIYIGLFFAMVGAEVILGLSLVGEAYACSLVLLGGGGLVMVVLGAIIFSMLVIIVKSRPI